MDLSNLITAEDKAKQARIDRLSGLGALSVTRFQAMVALHNAGLYDQVNAAMSDPATPLMYQLAWKESLNFERGSATVAAMGTQLSLTEAQLDDLFIAASKVSA